MTTAIQNQGMTATAIEKVLMAGDLKELTPEQRVTYYKSVCDSLGLNPLTKPFDFLNLGGKLVLYARRDCAEQLRKIRNISVKIVDRSTEYGVYVVKALARDPGGREDESTGAVSIEGLKGEALANALMKAETKAKRRVTLSICGLGMLDETETESIPGARTVPVEITNTARPQLQQAPRQQQPPADPFEPTPAEIEAAVANGEAFQAAIKACCVPWAAIIDQLNDEFGTDYTDADTIENDEHARWIVRNALYETKRKAATK